MHNKHKLTAREIQVMYWGARGLSHGEVGRKLNIATRTAQSLRHHATGKIGVGSFIGACIKAGFLLIPEPFNQEGST